MQFIYQILCSRKVCNIQHIGTQKPHCSKQQKSSISNINKSPRSFFYFIWIIRICQKFNSRKYNTQNQQSQTNNFYNIPKQSSSSNRTSRRIIIWIKKHIHIFFQCFGSIDTHIKNSFFSSIFIWSSIHKIFRKVIIKRWNICIRKRYSTYNTNSNHKQKPLKLHKHFVSKESKIQIMFQILH